MHPHATPRAVLLSPHTPTEAETLLITLEYEYIQDKYLISRWKRRHLVALLFNLLRCSIIRLIRMLLCIEAK